ncbi:hypothetical protein [Mycoplasmopsis pullorum]|nr:hypothetical protein [Mycoplasmopsis pullorum]
MQSGALRNSITSLFSKTKALTDKANIAKITPKANDIMTQDS